MRVAIFFQRSHSQKPEKWYDLPEVKTKKRELKCNIPFLHYSFHNRGHPKHPAP